MSSHDNEPLDVPSIVPERDDDRPVGRRRSARNNAAEAPLAADRSAGGTRGGAGLWLALLLVLALAGWSGWQQWQLMQSQQQLINYERRVADLEQRLSLTDESVSESSVAMQVKLKELDSEIRKLWDNVWKRSREQLASHEEQITGLTATLKSAQAELGKAQKSLSEQQQTLGQMRGQLDKATGLEAAVELSRRQSQEQQVALEALSTRVRQFQDSVAKLEQRVVANEEWVQSINAFRRQVNRDLLALKEQSAP